MFLLGDKLPEGHVGDKGQAGVPGSETRQAELGARVSLQRRLAPVVLDPVAVDVHVGAPGSHRLDGPQVLGKERPAGQLALDQALGQAEGNLGLEELLGVETARLPFELLPHPHQDAGQGIADVDAVAERKLKALGDPLLEIAPLGVQGRDAGKGKVLERARANHRARDVGRRAQGGEHDVALLKDKGALLLRRSKDKAGQHIEAEFLVLPPGIGHPLGIVRARAARSARPDVGRLGEHALLLLGQVWDIVLVRGERDVAPERFDGVGYRAAEQLAPELALAEPLDLLEQEPVLDLHELGHVEIDKAAVAAPDLVLSPSPEQLDRGQHLFPSSCSGPGETALEPTGPCGAGRRVAKHAPMLLQVGISIGVSCR